MRKVLIPFSLLFFGLFACQNQQINIDENCFDPKAVDEESMCTMQYDPVCGCDNKTYGNECQARKKGILKWEKGECPK